MPIFMDRHDVEGVTAEEVAKAHQEDLKIQEKYDCRALTYWFDEERGTAFCLIEAPDRQAVKQMHDDAHGLMPHRIIEVQNSTVEVFLGRIEDPEPTGAAADLARPAFRSIVVIKLKDAAVILSEVGTTKSRELFNVFNQTIRQSCREFEGQIAQSTYDGFVTTFASVSKSVECAVTIQKRVKERVRQRSEYNFHAGIGIHGGEPVTGSEDFFGDAIQLAERLSYIAAGGEIRVSSEIKEQFKKEKLSLLPESKSLKSLSSKEEQFLNRLMDTTGKIWNREGVKVRDFCRQIGVSKSQLYRNTTKLTGHSPTEFIKEFKLKKAVELMTEHPESIAEVAFETGFNNPSYFAKCFKERFGILPSEYRNRMD